MISKKSFVLFDTLVNEGKDKYIFDLTIINQVSETMDLIDLLLNESDFEKLCNEVKRQVLKYEDVVLNDDLVQTIINELGLGEG